MSRWPIESSRRTSETAPPKTSGRRSISHACALASPRPCATEPFYGQSTNLSALEGGSAAAEAMSVASIPPWTPFKALESTDCTSAANS